MKNLAVLTGLAVILLVLSGCNNPENTGKTAAGGIFENKADATKPFPKFLVGVWQADKFNWAFKFEPDGHISKLEHQIGQKFDVKQGGVFEENGQGDYGAFILGPCESKYDPKTRQLSVKIVIDYYRIEIKSQELEGNTIDYFDGFVSKDGKTWTANWRSYGWLKDAALPDPNLIEANPEKLVFTKKSLAELQHEHE